MDVSGGEPGVPDRPVMLQRNRRSVYRTIEFVGANPSAIKRRNVSLMARRKDSNGLFPGLLFDACRKTHQSSGCRRVSRSLYVRRTDQVPLGDRLNLNTGACAGAVWAGQDC